MSNLTTAALLTIIDVISGLTLAGVVPAGVGAFALGIIALGLLNARGQ